MIPNGAENVFLLIEKAATEVLNKSHFSLQMGNCPIPVAEHSGLSKFKHLSYGFSEYSSSLTFFLKLLRLANAIKNREIHKHF